MARLLLREATYVGDEEHLDFFGGRSIPVMLGCPDQTLEVMPYAVAARAEEVGLCVCDLQVRREKNHRLKCSTRAMVPLRGRVLPSFASTVLF